jgi:uncharacterized membrane protein
MAEDYMTSRLVTLTDGVLSIAMTLLILDVRLPGPADTLSNEALWRQIVGIWPQIFSYGLSFVVIAILWMSHARKFRHLTRMTGLMIWLNIFFLFGVGIVPFTTALLAENGNAVSTAIYAFGIAFASLMLASMSVHARTSGLVEAAPGQMFSIVLSQFGTAAVFLVSAGVAFINAEWAKYLWLLLIPLGFVRDQRDAARQAKHG